MPKIDAHQHFWKYDPLRDHWITNEMAVIQKDFLPDDLAPILKQHGFDGCIVVQSDQSEAETGFQLDNAGRHPFIKGVVGWVDLQADNLEDRLAYYQQFDLLKGFRHVLQGEADRALMLRPAFMNGIRKLQKFGFSYDILIYPDQLKYLPEFVSAFPEQLFVIDHLAKPDIKNKSISDWNKEMLAVAGYENLSCKVSGMVTEADWHNWKQADFTPYLDLVFEAFGAERVMFGSDWPVCKLAATYTEVVEIASDYISKLSDTERNLFWSDNATRFYKLNP